MKKNIRIFIVLLAVIFIPLTIQATGPQPHPDPYSGDLSGYDGKWILDGATESNSNWTLEISDGKYHLENKYQEFDGEVIFTPGNKDLGRPDTLWLDFDPSLNIEIVLINEAGGLIDVTGQGFLFVRPGNTINFDEYEEYENYSKKDMIGDWVLDKMWVILIHPGFSHVIELTNEEIMSGCVTGDTRLIISFDNGILYQVSEKLEFRVPISYYLNRGNNRKYFENPNPYIEYAYKFDAYIVPEGKGLDYEGQLVIDTYPLPDEPIAHYIHFVFSRITEADISEGGE